MLERCILMCGYCLPYNDTVSCPEICLFPKHRLHPERLLLGCSYCVAQNNKTPLIRYKMRAAEAITWVRSHVSLLLALPMCHLSILHTNPGLFLPPCSLASEHWKQLHPNFWSKPFAFLLLPSQPIVASAVAAEPLPAPPGTAWFELTLPAMLCPVFFWLQQPRG